MYEAEMKQDEYVSECLMYKYDFVQSSNLWLVLAWLVDLFIQQILFAEQVRIPGSALGGRGMKMNKASKTPAFKEHVL